MPESGINQLYSNSQKLLMSGEFQCQARLASFLKGWLYNKLDPLITVMDELRYDLQQK